MKTFKTDLYEKFRRYRFELKHLLVLLAILICFQVFVSFVHKMSLQNFLSKSQKWYKQDFAERLANLSATSLELLLETTLQNQHINEVDAKKIIQAINIILTQQLMQHHVEEVCILLSARGNIIPIDNGQLLFSYFFKDKNPIQPTSKSYASAISMYKDIEDQIVKSEQIYSVLEGQQTFHVFIPFVPKGEYTGVVYMKTTPSFGFVTGGIMSSYNETSLIFTALIFFGLLAMFYISSYTVKERNEAQNLLYQEKEKKLKEHIHLQKEALFAKRIYHTHHKAEKIMGFIKEDLQALATHNFDEIKYRVNKYANFISRVIYDMKWYDPPLQVIRSPIFNTDLNELIRFIVNHIFLRLSSNIEQYEFKLALDKNLPIVHVNEFVIWEIIEPLIQNCVEHSGDHKITIQLKTEYLPELKQSKIIIADDGVGIESSLLKLDESGIKRIFLENVSTKKENQRSGYGCYIAYEIATQRCGWQIDAQNLADNGCQFIISIPNS